MTGAPRVGIFGGTFNPIHLGHLRAAEEVSEALALERLIFVPCAQPPHKRGSAEDPIAPAAERLAWVRAATAGNPRFEVDPLEVDRKGPSYSVETLRTLVPGIGAQAPVFIIGHDAFVEVGTWREPEALLTLAHFAVIARPPVAEGTLADWMPKCLRDDVEMADDGLSARHRAAKTWIRVVEIRALDVSASDIRARLREGRSVRYLVPEAVIDGVVHSGVYAQR
jgi:nicotinate-nucleotide adenylyltransferase